MTSTEQTPFTPHNIPYHEPTAALVQQLLKDADALEVDYDTEPYSDKPEDGHQRPFAKAAWAVKTRPFARFQAAGFAVLRAICGSDGHPLCRQWLTDVHSPVVYAVRKGAGILEGFLVAWQLGGLWSSSDEPRGPSVQQAPEDFGTRNV